MHPNAQPLEEARRQLSLLLQQQEELAPGLYRDLALYLQVLREGLLPAVQQACFHLATQVVPERYNQLPSQRRLQFQQRLAALVRRCSALLTVEQLMSLAAQQQRREHRRLLAQRERWLEAVLQGGHRSEASSEASSEPRAETRPDAPSSSQGPQGSVHLGLDLPLSADLFDQGLPGLPRPQPQAPAEPTSTEPADPAGKPAAADQELDLLRSLFQMAAEGLGDEGLGSEGIGSEGLKSEGQPSEGLSRGDVAARSPIEIPATAAMELAPLPDPAVIASQLPRDPLLQIAWWRHFDRALSRRLRNLSHALNVEMMRLGLAQGLLPLNLLDAVLDGQVEVQPAPANLLRLALPLAEAGSAPTAVLAVLLRPGDLEYEQPRLRTCRTRLEHRRRALRTMAKRYRTWQRRVTALEAEQQWYRDSAQLQSRPLPPS